MVSVVSVLATATLLIDLILVLGAAVYVGKRLFGFELPEFIGKLENKVRGFYQELAFLLAIVATSGSLYLSNFLGWEPCRLCWFQRILMYPLVVVMGVGILFNDENARDYAIPLTLIGIPIALYHSMVQRFEQFHSAGCSVFSVSCSTEYTFHFGYITIPVMALTAFVGILVLVWLFND